MSNPAALASVRKADASSCASQTHAMRSAAAFFFEKQLQGKIWNEPRPRRARSESSNARRPARHHHARRDAEDDAENRDGRFPVVRVTRSNHPLADSQQYRRQETARRASGWLASRRQDRWRRTGTNNDIAMLWPTGRAPVLVTCFLTQSSADLRVRDWAIAEVGKVVVGLAVGDNSA